MNTDKSPTHLITHNWKSSMSSSALISIPASSYAFNFLSAFVCACFAWKKKTGVFVSSLKIFSQTIQSTHWKRVNLLSQAEGEWEGKRRERRLLSLLFPSPSPSAQLYYQYTLFQTKLLVVSPHLDKMRHGDCIITAKKNNKKKSQSSEERNVRITSWYPHFNGSHFGSPPSSIYRITGLGVGLIT